MAAVQKVCVIGGGFSGMAAAIQMRRAGLEVDLYEIDAQWCRCWSAWRPSRASKP